MIFDRGALLLIPFPFSDLSASKRRPVLVLTPPDTYADFLALPVTSRPQHLHSLPLAPSDLVVGTLPRTSWVRTDRVVTLSASLVAKSFGQVTDRLLEAAIAGLCQTLTHRQH